MRASLSSLRGGGPNWEPPAKLHDYGHFAVLVFPVGHELGALPGLHCYGHCVQVVLRKLGRGSRAVAGKLIRAPRKGSVIVIEFSDGMHEYVTTPVKRVMRVAERDVFYVETANSRYRLEVRDRETDLDDALSG